MRIQLILRTIVWWTLLWCGTTPVCWADAPSRTRSNSWAGTLQVLGGASQFAFGIKKQSGDHAFRFGVDTFISSIDSDTDSGSSSPRSSHSRRRFNGLGLDYLHYGNTDAKLAYLFGVGTMLGRAVRDSESVANGASQRTEARAWIMGTRAFVGTEWWILERMGVFAEYGYGFSYRWENQESSSSGTTTVLDRTMWEFFDRSSVGLTFYF